MNLKEISEELASYIADAERLERVREIIHSIDNRFILNKTKDRITLRIEDYEKLKALIDDE